MIPILGKMIPGFEQKKKKKKIIIFFLGKGKKKNLGKKNRHLKMIPQTQKKLKTQKQHFFPKTTYFFAKIRQNFLKFRILQKIIKIKKNKKKMAAQKMIPQF